MRLIATTGNGGVCGKIEWIPVLSKNIQIHMEMEQTKTHCLGQIKYVVGG